MGAPKPFALGVAPEAQEWPEETEKPTVTGLATHTGTDPYGRAIGPAEDHTKAKKDVDGKTARGPAGAASREFPTTELIPTPEGTSEKEKANG